MQKRLTSSESVSSDSLGELEVTGHDGNSLGMDGAQVGVFEQGHQVGFSWLLEGQNSWALESELLLELVGDFSNESLEGELSDEEVSWFLIFSNFSEGNCSGFEAVGFLDSSGDWGALSGDLLSDQLFPGNLLGSWFPCSLFCSSHLKS